MDVAEAVERIRLLPDAFIDCSYRQGRDCVSEQLRQRSGKDDPAFVDAVLEDIHNGIAELAQTTVPYRVPEDYLFFLELYGGLCIASDNYYLSPEEHDWLLATIDRQPWLMAWCLLSG